MGQALKLPQEVVQSPTVTSFYERWESDLQEANLLSKNKAAGIKDRTTFLEKPNEQYSKTQKGTSLPEFNQSKRPSSSFPLQRQRSESADSSIEKHSLRPKSSIDFQKASVTVEQPYKVICPYTKRKEGEVELIEGQIVDVLEKSLSGWWFVHVEKVNQQGWAPGAFLEPIFNTKATAGFDDGDYATLEDATEQRSLYRTVCSYTAQNSDEISYTKGQTVEVLEKNLDGWWKVKIDSHIGFTAATNLQVITDNQNKLPTKERSYQVQSHNSLYSKKPPPRRSTIDKENRKSEDNKTEEEFLQLYAKVNKRRTTLGDSPIYDNAPMMDLDQEIKPKGGSESDDEPLLNYAEIVFDGKKKKSKGVLPRQDSEVTYCQIDLLAKAPPMVDSDEIGKKPKKAAKANYLNVIPKGEYENIAMDKGQDMIGKLFKVKEQHSGHTKHIESLKVKAGDVVMVEKVDASSCFCVLCGNDEDSELHEGWLPVAILEPYGGNVKGKNRHSVPMIDISKVSNLAANIARPRPQAVRVKKPELLEKPKETVRSPLPEESFTSLPEAPPSPSFAAPMRHFPIPNAPAEAPMIISTKVKALSSYSSKKDHIISFEKGDVGIFIKENSNGWWCVQTGDKIGWVPSQYWDVLPARPVPSPRSSPPLAKKKTSLEDEPWYIGLMGRAECETLLLENGKERNFVVRKSDSQKRVGDYTLSVKFGKKCRHFPINVTPNGKYFIGKHDFSSIEHVVKHYRKKPLFYDDDGKEVSLGEPLVLKK